MQTSESRDRRPTGPEFLAAFIRQATHLPPHPTAEPVTGKWGERVQEAISRALREHGAELEAERRRHPDPEYGLYGMYHRWVRIAAYRCEPWASRTNRQMGRFFGELTRDFGRYYHPAKWPELWR